MSKSLEEQEQAKEVSKYISEKDKMDLVKYNETITT